jgi:uncharacterized membrane protein
VAVKENTRLVVASDALHLVAVAFWAGALPFLFWTLLRGPKLVATPLPWASRLVQRFSRLALLSVAVLGLTGLYQSWVHLGHLHALLETPYGNVLLIKAALFLSMIMLGAWNLLSTRPQLARAGDSHTVLPKALKKIGAEGLLGLLVFGVTGLLTLLPPGVHSAHQAAHVHAAPGQRPTNVKLEPADGASVTLISPRNGQEFKSDQIPVSFSFVKGKRGEHVHAYVDGQLMGMFKSETGTLTGIQPGRHILELRAVARDHQTELDATATVEFIVK